MILKIKYHNPDLIRLRLTEEGDWCDLRASEQISLTQGQSAKIPLGVSIEIPLGYEAHIVPRSSTFDKWGIIQTNGMGIVDNKYKGNDDIWKMAVYATRDTTIKVNDAICQFRIVEKQPPLSFKVVEDMGNENRGGFGVSGDSGRY